MWKQSKSMYFSESFRFLLYAFENLWKPLCINKSAIIFDLLLFSFERKQLLLWSCRLYLKLQCSNCSSHKICWLFNINSKSAPFLPDDIKNVQSTLHRNQSPSPSRGSSRASSSPVSSASYISDACTSLSKAEDATTATSTSMSSSPVNAGPSSYRAQWVLARKLSGRSRFSELQGENISFSLKIVF